MSEPEHLEAELVPPDASGSLVGQHDDPFPHEAPRLAKTWAPSVRPKRRLPILILGTALVLSMLAGALFAGLALLVLAGVANRSVAVPQVSAPVSSPAIPPTPELVEPDRVVAPVETERAKNPAPRSSPRPDPLLQSR